MLGETGRGLCPVTGFGDGIVESVVSDITLLFHWEDRKKVTENVLALTLHVFLQGSCCLCSHATCFCRVAAAFAHIPRVSAG